MQNAVITDVLVFKTTIRTDNDVERVRQIFCDDARIRRWNVDLEDIDRVLRVEASERYADDIIARVREAGFWCEELTD